MNEFLTISKSVQLKPYVQRPFKSFELMSDVELLNGAGGTMIVDCEAYPNYFLIAFKDYATKKIIKFEINDITGECFNERKLSWILHSYRTVGFNSIKFDLPIIWLSYSQQNCKIIKEACNFIILQNEQPRDIAKRYGFFIPPTKHIDLIEVCPLRGSLKLYGARLHAPRIQDLPFAIEEPLTEQQIEIVADYCINDLDTTELLLENLKEQLSLREELSIQYNEDLMSKSDAQIAERVISLELKRLTGSAPKRPDIEKLKFKFQVPHNIYFKTPYLQGILNKIASVDFGLDEYGRLERSNNIKDLKIYIGNSVYRMGIGGLHSSEELCSYSSNDEYKLYDTDVASFYPRIVQNLKLYPLHLGEPFLQTYNELVEKRLNAKKNKRIAESENLKVTINGTFGKTGSPYSVLYAPQMTIQITVGGQLYLLMLIEEFELNGIQVVSANTDGVVCYCHKDKRKLMKTIVEKWEYFTQFKTEETEYKSIYSRDVNAYMAVKYNREIKGKNIYYDPWKGKTAKDAYWRFQKNPTAQICIEAIENLILNGTAIEETIEKSSDITRFVIVKNVTGGAHKDGEYLGKVCRWYHAKNVMGTINYIQSGNKVPDSEGGKPCQDLPLEFPTDINYDWYVKRTTEMLFDMSYYQRPKQMTFF